MEEDLFWSHLTSLNEHITHFKITSCYTLFYCGTFWFVWLYKLFKLNITRTDIDRNSCNVAIKAACMCGLLFLYVDEFSLCTHGDQAYWASMCTQDNDLAKSQVYPAIEEKSCVNSDYRTWKHKSQSITW